MVKQPETKVVGAAALLAAAAMAGCGHLPMPNAQAPQAAPAVRAQSAAAAMPTAVGTNWTYKVVAHPANDPYVDEHGEDSWTIEGAKREGAAVALQLRSVDSFTNRLRFPTLTVDAKGVALQGVSYWGPNPEELAGHSVPMLRFPLATGGKWDDGSYSTSVGATETVKVPAGSFQAFKLSFIGTAPLAPSRAPKPRSGARKDGAYYTGVGTLWFAPGVGVVKGEVNDGFWHYESELKALPAPQVRIQPVGLR